MRYLLPLGQLGSGKTVSYEGSHFLGEHSALGTFQICIFQLFLLEAQAQGVFMQSSPREPGRAPRVKTHRSVRTPKTGAPGVFNSQASSH